ncbi:MAG: hypothetical protein H7235_07745 [Bdellovibrionaceae bacterium]|nr:hypothetical protein [Pseudobdellovibrionaceae bacterium]
MKSLLVLALFFVLPVLAADIKMLDIKSDVDGDLAAEILIQTKADTTIQNVIYKNPTKPTEVWAMTDLNNDKVTIVKKSGVAVVEISAETITKNSFLFNIHFLYKYGLFGSDRRLKQLKMFYIAPSNLYQTMDMDTKKIITNALFVARMEGGKQKGVDRIDTW